MEMICYDILTFVILSEHLFIAIVFNIFINFHHTQQRHKFPRMPQMYSYNSFLNSLRGAQLIPQWNVYHVIRRDCLNTMAVQT